MIRFGEDVCRNVDSALRREWLRDERDWRVCLGNNQRIHAGTTAFWSRRPSRRWAAGWDILEAASGDLRYCCCRQE